MTRLTHSTAGFLRSLQISSTEIFAFVEGSVDLFFYTEVCSSVCGLAVPFEVVTARSLHGNEGGKQRLLKLYDYLRKRQRLSSSFKSKPLEIIFFLDKDIDDLRRSKRRSRHVVYTEGYDVENHIFTAADLAKAAATAASIGLPQAALAIGEPQRWRVEAAGRWKEWVKICVTSSLLKIRSGLGYSVNSKVNKPLYGQVDTELRDAALERLQGLCVLSKKNYQNRVDKISKRIDVLYEKGRHDSVFKGKWYAAFLAETIVEGYGGSIPNQNNLGSRIVSCALATLDFDESWAECFKQPVVEAVRRVDVRAAAG